MDNKESEFHKVYDAFRPKILRYLARLAGESEAEDLTQDVFAKISVALETFRGESSLSTWIYRIATNAVLDKLRSPSFRSLARKGDGPTVASETALDDEDALADDTATSAETSVIQKEMQDCIRNYIDNLPEDYRAVIILSDFEGLKDSEIAEILGVTLETAKIRLHRARTKLKKEFESGCILYRDERNELACDQKNPADDQQNPD